MSLLDYFETGYSPTNIQRDILNKIYESLAKKTKFIIISAPTGTGKSFISKTLSNYCEDINPIFRQNILAKNYKNIGTADGGCFVLTITKSLQTQYSQFFSDAYIFKGKSNYECALNEKLNCEVGACVGLNNIKKNCISGNKCPYYNAMIDTLINKFSVLNYSSFFKLPDNYKKRQMIICDEASELEDELVSNFTLDITYDTLKKYGINTTKLSLNATQSEIKQWVEGLNNDINEILNNIEEILKQNINDPFKFKNVVRLISKYKHLQNITKIVCEINKSWDECEYIRDGDDKHIILQPLYVNKLSKHLFSYADTIVLLSATIINHKKFASTLGIEESEYDYIEAPSSFDASNAPIYIAKNNLINYKNIDALLPKISKQLIFLCNKHKNEKGIIHTHTNKITNYIYSNIIDKRFTIRKDDITNEDILRIHKYKPNSILISPSLGFGVDLKDDLARFQIIIKLPFLPINSKRVKLLLEKDKDWYLMKMFVNLIQSCGRGVRSEKDYCVTYIMDSTLINILTRYSNNLPSYFIDRFV